MIASQKWKYNGKKGWEWKVDCSYVIVLPVYLNVGKYESTYSERISRFACAII